MIEKIVQGQRRPGIDNSAALSAATNGWVSIQELLFPDGLPVGASMTPNHRKKKDLVAELKAELQQSG